MSGGQPLDASAPEIPGYRLVERIGAGGSGVVYRAEGTDGLGRVFAIKVFPPGQQDLHEREVESLKAIERVRAAAGSHDLVETVSADTTADGHGYVVMEYVQGGSLEDRVRASGPIQAREAVDLLLGVLRGLSLLHRDGILHKDVKPANVLIGDDGRPRLGDFGLARPLQAPVSSAGTPGFCAPELYAGRSLEAGGERLDVYSAGATLYYLLTAEAPLPGRPDLFLLERLRVDRGLQGVLFEALADDPARRVSTAEALATRLTDWSQGRLAPGAPAQGWLRTAAVLLLFLLLPLAWILSTRADVPPLLWDGQGLSCEGPGVSWSTDGKVRVVGAGGVKALGSQPVASGRSADGWVLAAIGRWGEAVAIDLSGEPRVLYRLPGRPLPDGVLPLVAVATDGRHLARTIVHMEPGQADVLEIHDLERGVRLDDVGDPMSASALALCTEPGSDRPTLLLGTPSGRLFVRGPGGEHVLRTHQDEILAIALSGDRVLVVGDDRGLLPPAQLTGDAVFVPDGSQGLSVTPNVVLRIYALAPLLSGRLKLLSERAAGARLQRAVLNE